MTEVLLQDRRVLVVEDEYLVAEAMSRSLRRAGATVLGPVANVEGALALLDGEDLVHAAVLDINLGEHKVYPVVDVLRARGTRCVFATGNDAAEVPPAYASVVRCEKPVDPFCIVHALVDAPVDVAPAAGRGPLHSLREQLLRHVAVADEAGESLLAAKLCEAIDVIDLSLAR